MRFSDTASNRHLALAASRYPGPDYYEVLAWVHARLRPSNYIEIGVQTGASLSLAKPPTLCVGIDPYPQVAVDFTAPTVLFDTTSDEFFAKHDLATILDAPTFSLAFIDGLHLFEQALRDFINLEPFADRNSVILVHDCIPLDDVTSSRERTTVFHSGDVWKMVRTLLEFRPDLRTAVVETPPTGLCMVRGLSAESKTLSTLYPEIVRRFTPLGYESYVAHPEWHAPTIPNAYDDVVGWLDGSS